MVSSVVGLLGFLLAFTTYNQWLGNKKRDDAYLIAKDYISALNETREIIRELNFHYNHLCPSPGLIIESQENATRRIEYICGLSQNLRIAKVKINTVKSELNFWNVRLSETFDIKHSLLNEYLTNISVVLIGLNSQLQQYYAEKKDNIAEVMSEKKLYDSYVCSAINVLEERLSLDFEKVFVFK